MRPQARACAVGGGGEGVKEEDSTMERWRRRKVYSKLTQEEEESLFKADPVNEEDPERDRATQV